MHHSVDEEIFPQRLWCLKTQTIFLFGIWITCTFCLGDFTHNLGLILSSITFMLLFILIILIFKPCCRNIIQSNLVTACYLVHALIEIMTFYVFMSYTDTLTRLNFFWLLIVMHILTSVLLHMPFRIVAISACLIFAAITFLPWSQTKASLFCLGSAILLGLVISYLARQEVVKKYKAMQKLASASEENVEARAQELKKAYLKELIHEIGTPLMVLSLGNESIEEMGNSCPEVLKIVKSNRKAIELLTRLRERALDVTKQSEGILLCPRYEKVDIRKLVFKRCSEIMTAFNSSKSHERVQVTYHVEQSVPKYMKSDEDFIWDMLCCLLSNARKFVTDGKIKTVVSYNEAEQLICFQVFDTGKGVDEENRKLLFKPFTQFQSGCGGTGLGLYSVKLKAEALKGKVGYLNFSESDKTSIGLEGYETGSIFWFSIPYHSVEEKRQISGIKKWHSSSVLRMNTYSSYKPSSKLSSFEQRNSSSFIGNTDSIAPSPNLVPKELRFKTLLNRNNKMQVVIPDSKYGAKTEVFTNPREMGIERVSLNEVVCRQEPVEIVSIPQCSNYQANLLDNLKNLSSSFNKLSPRQALTGRRLSVLLETPESGICSHLRQSNCDLHTGSQPEDTGCLLETDSLHLKEHPILLIEDEVSILKMLSRMLRKQGYLVDTAENGKVGLQKLIEHKYRCAFCDITMPEMDGYETLQRFRQWESQQVASKYRRLYVCALSANSDKTSKLKAIDSGFDNFLSKPTNIKQILEEIGKVHWYTSHNCH